MKIYTTDYIVLVCKHLSGFLMKFRGYVVSDVFTNEYFPSMSLLESFDWNLTSLNDVFYFQPRSDI